MSHTNLQFTNDRILVIPFNAFSAALIMWNTEAGKAVEWLTNAAMYDLNLPVGCTFCEARERGEIL
jgi:hypothetical protein